LKRKFPFFEDCLSVLTQKIHHIDKYSTIHMGSSRYIYSFGRRTNQGGERRLSCGYLNVNTSGVITCEGITAK